MNAVTVETLSEPSQSVSDRLNKTCYCLTLDRGALYRALEHEAGDPEFCSAFVKTRPNLFSNVPVFLPRSAIAEMGGVVAAIEATSRLPSYRSAVLSRAPDIARKDFGPIGVFMGYDFHLDDSGPKLIEVNTNAGGALLNALLARAQRACCAEIEPAVAMAKADSFEVDVLRMFETEWQRQRGGGRISRIAIVDDRPQEQYLYPEFVLARQLFLKHGIDAVIADASELRYEEGRLLVSGQHIDLVYNRLVDFSLDLPEHAAIMAAYQDGAVVLTPNPHNHALLADKRNLALLSDPATLEAWGLSSEMRAHLAGVPRTTLVTPDNADVLWQSRKELFFKPTGGHGGKAVYRGDKVTKTVWSEIGRGGYVAQRFAAPGERIIKLDDGIETRKMDVRLYTYDGQILLSAARLYQGQTTNFRTPGGGFAPVFVV